MLSIVTGKNSNVSTKLPDATASCIPWRKTNPKHSSNEVYVNLVEEMDAVFNREGIPVKCEIYGEVQVNSHLPGSDLVPVATWTVTKAKGGSLAFLPANPSFHESTATNGANQLFLVFMNGEHEDIIFNPHKKEDIVSNNFRKSQAAQDEAERLGYTSIYGDLSNSNAKHNHFQEVPFVLSERPWETIFSGSSHVLTPLTKLCTSFFESLLEKRLEKSEETIIDADL